MERRLRGIDVLGLLLAGVCLVEMAIGLAAQPRFASMLADFGISRTPLATLMLAPAPLVVIGLLPLALVAEGILARRAEAAMVARSIVAIVVGLGLALAFLGALTLPAQLVRSY
jgi:hypothetical protein